MSCEPKLSGIPERSLWGYSNLGADRQSRRWIIEADLTPQPRGAVVEFNCEMVATTLRQETHWPFEVHNVGAADTPTLHPRLVVGPACAVGPRKTSDVEVAQESVELLDPTTVLS